MTLMKKISFLLATVALVCAMTTSCSKEENNQSVKDQFYAAVDNSKISLTGTGITNWNAGDKIMVFGYDAWEYNLSSCYKLVNGSGTSTGVFEHTLDLDDPEMGGPWPTLVHGPYWAFYPFSAVEFITRYGEYDGESIVTSVSLSSSQRYDGLRLPLFARSETRQLTFNHMLSILKLHIQSDDITNLRHIIVTADKGICGRLPVVYDANENPYIAATDDDENYFYYNDIYIDVNQSITSGLDVYIGLPVGTYSSLRLDMYGEIEGEEHPIDMLCTKNLNSSFTFERNKLYPVTMEGLEFTPYKK